MSTETTDVKFSMQAFKEASLAFVGMDWVGKNTQDEQTNAAAQAVFAKISQAAKDALAEAKNPTPVSEAQDAPVVVALADEEPALMVGAHGATTVGSENTLEDDIAVCWDMAEQLEDDLEGASDEVATELRNAINLLKAAKTPADIEHAKRIAKAARAAAENSGSEAGDDEPTLNDKLNMLNQMYEAAKKEIEAAKEYVRKVDEVLEGNPDLMTKEELAQWKEYKELVARREKENEEMVKRQAKEREEAKDLSEEEQKALADKQLKERLEMQKRWNAQNASIWQTVERANERVQASGSEKDKQDMQVIVAATEQHIATQEEIKAENKAVYAAAEKIVANTKEEKNTVEKQAKIEDADVASFFTQMADKAPLVSKADDNEALLPAPVKVGATEKSAVKANETGALLTSPKELALAKAEENKVKDGVDVNTQDLGNLPLLPKGAFTKGPGVAIS